MGAYYSGKKLLEFRQAASLSQQELGDAIGVTNAAINHYEQNNREPSTKTAKLIADKLGVPLDEFFSYD